VNYLFFLLTILYSFIYYIFYSFSNKRDIFGWDLDTQAEIINLSLRDPIQLSTEEVIVIQSFFGNLIYEIVFFLLVSIFFYIYFSSVDTKKKEPNFLVKMCTLENIKIFWKSFSYYIGFILFYISLYLITTGIGIHFQVFMLLINLLVLLFYFLSRFSEISRKFLRINSILFSAFYIYSYFYILFTGENTFSWIDFLNGFFLLWIFPLLIFYDKKILKKEIFDPILVLHMTMYFFSWSIFYAYHYILHENLIFWMSVESSILGILYFYLFPQVSIFQKSGSVFSSLGFCLMQVGIFFWVIFQFFQFSWIILWVFCLQLLINTLVYWKQKTVFSLFCSIFITLYLFITLFLKYFSLEYTSTFFSLVLLWGALFFVLIPYIFTHIPKREVQILYIFSHIINLGWFFLFLFYNATSIVFLGMLLLWESLFFFLSSYKLSLLSKK